MKTISDFEEYVRVVLEIPYVDFSNMDILICEEVVQTLVEVFQRYPFLRHTLSAIGNKAFLNFYMNLNSYADYNTWQKNLYEFGIFYSHPFSYIDILAFGGSIQQDVNGMKYQFLSICFGDLFYNHSLEKCNQTLKYGAEMGNHPIHATTIRSCVYHEIGHLVDYLFGISQSIDFQNLYKNNLNVIEKNVSKYAVTSEKEFLAEAFSEFHCGDNQNSLVNETMNLVSCLTNDFQFSKVELENLNLTKKYKY